MQKNKTYPSKQKEKCFIANYVEDKKGYNSRSIYAWCENSNIKASNKI